MDGVVSAPVTCPACGEPGAEGARFCESCGAALTGVVATDAGQPDAGAPTASSPSQGSLPADDTAATAPATAAPVLAGTTAGEPASPTMPDVACPACGGHVADDGYCTQCGARAPVERDHREEQPGGHVGGVTDVGVRRRRNEDALALGVAGDVTVLVVCDGVSTAPDSDVASQAAATAARDVLVAGAGTHDAGAWSRLLVEAGHRADDAARAAVDDASARQEPPSCTFVAAVVTPDLLVAGWLGDSRVYWLPDAGTPQQLTEDDSVAAELMADGVPRATAERSPNAHAITRWLGADSHDSTARTVVTRPDGPGWVLACSDGLWNYASAPQDVADLLRDLVGRVGPDPLALSRELAAWACARGGHDNVTAALARVTAAAAGPDEDPGTAPTARRPGNLPSEAPPP